MNTLDSSEKKTAWLVILGLVGSFGIDVYLTLRYRAAIGVDIAQWVLVAFVTMGIPYSALVKFQRTFDRLDAILAELGAGNQAVGLSLAKSLRSQGRSFFLLALMVGPFALWVIALLHLQHAHLHPTLRSW